MNNFLERGQYVQAILKQFDSVRRHLPATPMLEAPADVVTLSNGTPVKIRPVHRHDAHALHQMHDRLSTDSLYFRYLRVYTPSLAEMQHLSRMEAEEGAVLVATVGPEETIIGVAYYVKDKQHPYSAEPAFLIEDRYQGQGLGGILFERLSRLAFSRGIYTFDALVHPANTAMMRVFQKSGYYLTETLAYDGREVRILLEPTASFADDVDIELFIPTRQATPAYAMA